MSFDNVIVNETFQPFIPFEPSLAERLTSTSIELFNTIPKHGRPGIRPNGIHEWTVLSTISIVHHQDIINNIDSNDIIEDEPKEHERCQICFPGSPPIPSTPKSKIITPISLGTGVKVLPATKLSSHGDTLHDSHAEILARRGFVRWLMDECRKVAKGEQGKGVMEWKDGLFKLKEGVEVWMYISTLPCGDASTLFTALHQPTEMAALKSSDLGIVPPTTPGSAIRGRNGYENYGAIRTKPGRSDSIPAISFSCSDKIASWNILGLQGALFEGLMAPVYLDGIVIGGVEEEGGMRELMRSEMERALWGRLSSLEGHLPSSYRVNKPQLVFTDTEFPVSKKAIASIAPSEPVACTLSVSFVPPVSTISEVLYSGMKQGTKWKAGGGLIKPTSRSKVSKFELMRQFVDLRRATDDSLTMDKFRFVPIGFSGHKSQLIYSKIDDDTTYYDLKHPTTPSTYQKVKELLRGHLRPATCLPFFEQCGELATTGVVEDVLGFGGLEPPFKGWIVSGARWESFNLLGEEKE